MQALTFWIKLKRKGSEEKNQSDVTVKQISIEHKKTKYVLHTLSPTALHVLLTSVYLTVCNSYFVTGLLKETTLRVRVYLDIGLPHSG